MLKFFQISRPTTLMLDCHSLNKTEQRKIVEEKDEAATVHEKQMKTLFRSNSSNLHKRQSTFVPAATTPSRNKFKLSSELDHIFVISNNRSSNTDDDNYDSIEVIDERRMKNMPKSDRARLYKSNTFICEEYYRNEPSSNVYDDEKAESSSKD